MEQLVGLKWKRPESSDFPKNWYTFKAKDTETDEIVDYFIEDLSESKIEEALNLFVEHFCKEEPICNACGKK